MNFKEKMFNYDVIENTLVIVWETEPPLPLNVRKVILFESDIILTEI